MHSIRSLAARTGLLSALFGTLTLLSAPAISAAPLTEYELVYKTAYAQLGDKWQYRGRGPDRFDCSGLVWYAFHENDLQDRIGFYRSVSGYYNWFKVRGQVSRSNPRPGDLVVWGDNQHVRIYIGAGKAISTLTNRRGVAVHDVFGYLGIRLKAYLHVQMTRPPV